MDKTTSCRNVGAFCRLFFAKVQKKVLKGQPYGNLLVDFFLNARLVLSVMFLLKAFTIT